LRPPAPEDVDAAGVDRVGGDGDIEAADRPACPFDDADAAREGGPALPGPTVRDERRADIHQIFPSLGCALFC
jgi:hypothetical protein